MTLLSSLSASRRKPFGEELAMALIFSQDLSLEADVLQERFCTAAHKDFNWTVVTRVSIPFP
jgi:hypothetical protein